MRPIYEIAKEIEQDWAKVHFAARPYLRAMHSLDKITDYYGADSAVEILLYFGVNAKSWRGPVARRIKLEIK